jgi:uncharacterized protein YodC (DUF2158 family)
VKLADARAIMFDEAPSAGYRVHFERIEGKFAVTDYFPDREEPPITSEEHAWACARVFASKTVGRFINLYVVNAHDSTPVQGYRERMIANRQETADMPEAPEGPAQNPFDTSPPDALPCGSYVMLRSGGPIMTVDRDGYDGSERFVRCSWFDRTGAHQDAKFRRAMLKPVSEEEFERMQATLRAIHAAATPPFTTSRAPVVEVEDIGDDD